MNNKDLKIKNLIIPPKEAQFLVLFRYLVYPYLSKNQVK